jgi:hypothetical protein
MPTSITCAAVRDGRLERLGGMHDGKLWSMAIGAVVAELSQPADSRRWDFVVNAHGAFAPEYRVGLPSKKGDQPRKN